MTTVRLAAVSRHHTRLRSGRFAVDATTVVFGVVVALALTEVLVWRPGLGGPVFEVSPIPRSVAEWVLVCALAVPPAVAAALGGSWLPCWWFPFPSFFVAYLHYFEAGSGTFVGGVGPGEVAGFALVAAVVVGTAGYLLGTAGREVYEQLGRVDLGVHSS